MNFKADWDRYYPGCCPIGYKLRAAGAQHWLRFHSLPGSKRHADTDDERRALLTRQDELARDVLASSNQCWLVQTSWETPVGMGDIADPIDMFWARREFALLFSFRFLDEDDEVPAWNVYAAQLKWEKGKFDELLLAIADEKAAPTLWMSESGAIFAPYDGGIDLFLPTLSAVERLAATHPEWLSAHPEGL